MLPASRLVAGFSFPSLTRWPRTIIAPAQQWRVFPESKSRELTDRKSVVGVYHVLSSWFSILREADRGIALYAFLSGPTLFPGLPPGPGFFIADLEFAKIGVGPQKNFADVKAWNKILKLRPLRRVSITVQLFKRRGSDAWRM